MSKQARKERTFYTAKQKGEYAKLMVEDGYTNRQIMEISRASSSAIVRWKQPYLQEKNGHDPHAYLLDVLTRLPTHKQKDLDELLPHKWENPANNQIIKASDLQDGL